MKKSKLNSNWQINQSNSNTKIELEDDLLTITFDLESKGFNHVEEGDSGKLKFYNVFAYRTKSITEEEYKEGGYRFKQKQLPWGQLYEIEDNKLIKDFPKDRIIGDEENGTSNPSMYVLFTENQIIECLASHLNFEFGLIDEIESKYPKAYFKHFITMYASQFKNVSADNFRLFIGLYLQLHKRDSFANLKDELRLIKMNNDQNLFIKLAQQSELNTFSEKHLKILLTVIKNYKV